MELVYDILSLLIGSVSEFFATATGILFLCCFYDPGFQWHKKKGILLSLFILGEFIIMIIASFVPLAESLYLILDIILLIYLYVILTWIVTYDYRGKRWQGILRFWWIRIVINICLFQITSIGTKYIFPNFNWITASYTDYLIQAIITYIIYIAIFGFVYFYLYHRIFKKQILLPWTKRERIFILIYSAACIVLSVIIKSPSENHDVSLIIMGATFVLTAVLIPVFFYYLRISEYFQMRTKDQDAYMQAELASFRQYKLAQEETKRFRHDVKNDLLCLKEMLETGKTEEACVYLKNLVEVTEALSEKYVTGDEIFDSILAAKGAVMEKEGIDFQLDGVLAGGLSWKPVDICCVFANALDNAIEACQQLPHATRHISIKIKTAPQFWFVRIENPVKEDFDTELLFKKQGGYTSKSDSSRHGIGTYSIKRTAENYGCIVKAECADKRFVLEIMIPQ